MIDTGSDTSLIPAEPDDTLKADMFLYTANGSKMKVFGKCNLTVSKANGEWRLVGDFRKLNFITKVDKYPTPFLTDFTNQMSGSRIFSSLDLYKSYHQLELTEDSIPKTAISTPFGLFGFTRLAMGLRNSQACMTRFMNEVLRGLSFVYCYIDDVLIFSRDHEEHLKHLQEVFQRFKHYGLILNIDKCSFAKSEIKFLGHLVNENGVAPLPDKVSAIRDFKPPKTVKGLRKFLGMLNFYRRFLPHVSELLKPLYALLTGKVTSRKTITLSDVEIQAFEASKTCLSNACMLAFPTLNADTQIISDASNAAAGAVLQQTVNGITKPLAFFSKNFTSAQQKYSTFDRELLAIVLAIKHFKYFVEGRDFEILTDHKPLTNIFSAEMKNATPFQTRQVTFISNFTTRIKYIPGEENVVADYLSRPNGLCNALYTEIPLIDYAQFAEAQQNDPEIAALLTDPQSLELEYRALPNSDAPLIVDISSGQDRPLVPMNFRKIVFDTLHNLSHPGIKASQILISSRFVWPKLKIDVRNFARTCIACQKNKIIRHNSSPFQKLPNPGERFAHVHVDIVGPLTVSCGFSYLLTVIDRYTRHFEAIPLREISAQTCADHFMLHWVSRFGCPQFITTDRGAQFTSAIWRELANFLGAKLIHTTSYHPQANGMVERLHRSLKVALRAQINPSAWFSNLGIILLGLRASVKQDLGFSTSELTIGQTLRVPGQFFAQNDNNIPPSYTMYRVDLLNYLNCLNAIPPRNTKNQKAFIDKALHTCSHVFIRIDRHQPPLSPVYDGPFAVLSKNEKYFTIDFGDHADTVSIDRLKAAHLMMPKINPLQISSPDEVQEIIHNFEALPHADAAYVSPAPQNSILKSPYVTRHGRNVRLPVRFR